MVSGIVVVLVVVIAWSLTSERLARWSVTAPIVLAVAGALLTWAGVPLFDSGDVAGTAESIKQLAELTLALVLFADASQITVRWFRSDSGPAARLLGIGLPLTVLLGFVVGLLLFPDADPWVIAVAAAALAPTDAALGAAIMADRRIPLRVRQTINVESGLNDGLATPFVLFFVAGAAAAEDRRSVAGALTEAVVEIGIALAVGALIGALGGWLVARAYQSGWASRMQEPIGVLAMALMSYVVAVGLHGNGFVAAFVAGSAFGTTVRRHRPPEILVFTERFGLMLSFAVWFVFGALMIPAAVSAATWQMVLYGVLSLTLIRMAPVALSMVRSGWSADTVGVVGWLGPRGLASIVFGLLALGTLGEQGDGTELVGLVTVTVTLSVLAHGLSAGPLAAWYSRRHPEEVSEPAAP